MTFIAVLASSAALVLAAASITYAVIKKRRPRVTTLLGVVQPQDLK